MSTKSAKAATKTESEQATAAETADKTGTATESAETVEVTDAENTVQKPDDENVIYLGATIPGIVRHAQVFTDGVLPGSALKAISEFPMMRRLFVRLSEMPEAVKELRKEQSALGAIYKQTAIKYTNKGGR